MVAEIQDPRIQIIHDLMKHGDWYQKEVYDLVQYGIDSTRTIGANVALAATGAKVAKVATAGSWTAKVGTATATAAVTAVAVTSAILVGYAGCKVFELYCNEKSYIRDVSKAADWALNNLIQDCLKNESCPDKYEDDVLKLGINLQKYRGHEAFLAWIDLEYEKIAGKQDEESLESQKKYQILISRHIRQEAIQSGRFEKEMRIFCAANKILADYGFKDGDFEPSIKCAGEFSHSKPNKNAPFFCKKSWSDWWDNEGGKRQKALEPQIQALLQPGHKFEEIRKKFYGAYKAKMYADCHQIKEISVFDEKTKTNVLYPTEDYVYSEYNKSLSEALGIEFGTKESELTLEQKIKVKEFKRFFYQYRYIGGDCEFNAHDFFQIKFFDKFYKMITESKGDLISLEKQFKRQFKGLVKDVTITLALGVFAGSLSYLNSQWKLAQEAHKARIARSEDALKSFQELGCSNFDQAKEVMGLKQQAELGIPGAKEQWNALQVKLQSFPSPSLTMCHDGICVGGEIKSVALANDNMIREALENLPLSQTLNYLQEGGFNEVYIPEVSEYIQLMLNEVREVGRGVVVSGV